MTGRALSVVELAEAAEAVDRAYSGWLDDPCRRTVEDVERAAALLKACAAAVGRREAAAEDLEGRPTLAELRESEEAAEPLCESQPQLEGSWLCTRTKGHGGYHVAAADFASAWWAEGGRWHYVENDHGGGCDGPLNCVCSAVTL